MNLNAQALWPPRPANEGGTQTDGAAEPEDDVLMASIAVGADAPTTMASMGGTWQAKAQQTYVNMGRMPTYVYYTYVHFHYSFRCCTEC